MRKVSINQAKRNAEIRKIKAGKQMVCEICGRYGDQLSHRLPKSTFPEYYTEPRNLQILCDRCHHLYDNDIRFRQRQKRIFRELLDLDEKAARRYFKIWD